MDEAKCELTEPDCGALAKVAYPPSLGNTQKTRVLNGELTGPTNVQGCLIVIFNLQISLSPCSILPNCSYPSPVHAFLLLPPRTHSYMREFLIVSVRFCPGLLYACSGSGQFTSPFRGNFLFIDAVVCVCIPGSSNIRHLQANKFHHHTPQATLKPRSPSPQSWPRGGT